MQAVELKHAYRLLNHGPTVLVGSAHAGQRDVMAAAWNMPLDFNPARVAVVVDKQCFTRGLMEASGQCVLSVPCRAVADLCFTLGSVSGRDVPGQDKLAHYGVATVPVPDTDLPLVDGCVAWLWCQLRPDVAMQQAYDLLVLDVKAAWADERAFAQGRWTPVDQLDPALHTLHHLGAGQFWLPGHSLQAQVLPPAAG